MRHSSVRTIVLTVFLLMVLSTSVAAQPGVFDSLERILGTDSLGTFYERFGLWVDLILMIFLFVYIAQFSFHALIQQDKAMRKVAIVVGIALAVSGAVWEANSGFRLGDLGPFAIAVLLIIMGWAIYQFIKAMGWGGWEAAAFAFVITYGFFLTLASPLFEELYVAAEDNAFLSLIIALLNIGLLVAAIALAFAVFKVFSRVFGGTGGGNHGSHEQHDEEVAEEHHEAHESSVNVGHLRNQLATVQAHLRTLQEMQARGAPITAAQLQAILQQIINIDNQLQHEGVHAT